CQTQVLEAASPSYPIAAARRKNAASSPVSADAASPATDESLDVLFADAFVESAGSLAARRAFLVITSFALERLAASSPAGAALATGKGTSIGTSKTGGATSLKSTMIHTQWISAGCRTLLVMSAARQASRVARTAFTRPI